MDNSVRQQESHVQQPGGFLFRSLKFFDRLEKWLTHIFEMTQEEQKDAGIYYPGEQPDE